MALINRIAISNVLNINGESPRAPWSPRFQYEVLSFYGQSSAINLTNGGGKTTLAEAILTALSRDTALLTRTKKKLSPSSAGVFSHVQVELVRPKASASQSDLLTNDGLDVNGDLWVFGMYGYKDSDEDISFYYYPGSLSECPIGHAEGDKRELVLNPAFMENLKAIRGCVRGARRHEWHEALSAKANLPLATLQQMVSFQKRPGDDKSALLLDVKTKPGESFAEAFFYKVLAPAVMEGIMDREGEEDEITLEDTVERAVYSTVKAKRDTEAYREQAEELERGIGELETVLNKAEEAEHQRAEYELRLGAIQQDSSALVALVRDGQLTGVPRNVLPEGLVGQIAPFVAVEPGLSQICILDRGLAILINKEAGHINQAAMRQKISGRKSAQVLEIPCDLEIQRGGHKSSMYTIAEASSLIEAITSGQKADFLKEVLEDLVSWFDQHADTNPFRMQLIRETEHLKQLTQKENELDKALKELYATKTSLVTQQQNMEANEGQYRALVASEEFSDEELGIPLLTEKLVQRELNAAQSALTKFATTKATLEQYRPAWEEFRLSAPYVSDPAVLLDERRTLLTKLNDQLRELKADLEANKAQTVLTNKELAGDREHLERCKKDSERIGEYRTAFEAFQRQFGDGDPISKEQELQDRRQCLDRDLSAFEIERTRCQEGVEALSKFQYTVESQTAPATWLANAVLRRKEVIVSKSDRERELADLHERRRALDKENVAANAATRRALTRLSQKQLAFVPIHQYVESLSLTSARQRQLLSLFSALLFAPVIENPSDAILAANELADNDEQVPVFLASSLERFCREGAVEMVCNDTLTVAALAGISTRAVECLIDPSLVHREKASLEEKANGVTAIIKVLEQELSELIESAPQIKLAQRADQALQDNEPARLEALKLSVADTSAALSAIDALCTPPMKDMMRRAAEYVRLGGRSRDSDYQQQLAALIDKCELLQEQLFTLEGKTELLEKNLRNKAGEASMVLPAPVENMLERAVKFHEGDGPEFFTTLEENEAQLNSVLARCTKRYSFSANFPAAQAYLDSVTKKSGTDDLASQIARVSRELSKTDEARQEVRNSYHRLNEKLPRLKQTLTDVDRAAIAAIAKYRQIAQLGVDIKVDDDLASHPLMDLAQTVRQAVMNEDLESVIQEARNFAAEIDDLQIERKAMELRAAQQSALRAEKAFIDQALNTAKTATAFKPVERDILQQVQSLKTVSIIRNLYHSLLETFNGIKERLDDCASAELEARRNVSSRLAHLIAMAKYDFDIMRQVMKENRGTHLAHFTIEAKILEIDDGKRLIESIIGDVDLLDKQRRDRQRINKEDTDADAFHSQIRDMLRVKLYKSIFSNPKISYTNQTIRAFQTNNEFTDSLSEGQKAAMSLMWMIRLAEFAIERSAKRMSGRSAQRKVRERAENVIIIDGIFSNLSDRHLIDSAMAGIETTRGRFQLIGLIHNPLYQNDFNKFPVFIIGKNRGVSGGKAGWVSFKSEPIPQQNTGTVGFAQLHKRPSTEEL